MSLVNDKNTLAYVIGVAVGDGNLSNPNGRAVRLRVTCDTKYELIIRRIRSSIQKLFPSNKVSTVKRPDNCIDISCYSNKWEGILSWKAGLGSKYDQNARIPKWIVSEKQYMKHCLRGLFETDGSIYKDRNYVMVNFVTIIQVLAEDVMYMIEELGFKPNLQILKPNKNNPNSKTKYTIRISRDSQKFIKNINLQKKKIFYKLDKISQKD